jgi:hypothetical protein
MNREDDHTVIKAAAIRQGLTDIDQTVDGRAHALALFDRIGRR